MVAIEPIIAFERRRPAVSGKGISSSRPLTLSTATPLETTRPAQPGGFGKAGESAPHKPFKAYEPGYVHVDVKHLPQMLDEDHERHLFVAIDRATRWVYLKVRQHQSAQNADAFLQHFVSGHRSGSGPCCRTTAGTFTDRFAAGGERQPSDRHRVDRFCRQHGIELRLIPPYRPQTNGMVERFNGRVSDVLNTHRFDSQEDLETTLKRYNWLDNHHINQKALHHQTPVSAMKQW